MNYQNNPITKENYRRAHTHLLNVISLAPPSLDHCGDRQLGELQAALWGLQTQVEIARNERALADQVPTDMAGDTTGEQE